MKRLGYSFATRILRTGTLRGPRGLGLAVGVLLSASGCWKPSATLGASCAVDEDCAGSQICDQLAANGVGECLAAGAAITAGDGDGDGDADGGDQNCDSAEAGQTRCAPDDPLKIQICSGGKWLTEDCAAPCMSDNSGTCGQTGVCNPGDGTGSATCTCADSLGVECDPSEGFQISCTGAGLLEFCDDETAHFLRAECSCECVRFGFPEAGAGPCVTEGGVDCFCADSVAGSCGGSEEGSVECVEVDTQFFLRTCLQGVRYETDCFAECERRGFTGGGLALCNGALPGGADCVCA